MSPPSFPRTADPPTAGAPPDVCGCSLVSASRRGALGRVRPSLSEKVPSLAIREEGVLPAGAAPRLLVFRAGSHRRVALRPSVGACSGREPPSFPLRCGEEGSAGPRGGGRAPALCLVAARASPLRVGGGSRRAGAGARCARVVGGVAACARACAALPRRWAGTPGGGGAWGPALRVTSPRPPRAFPSAPPPPSGRAPRAAPTAARVRARVRGRLASHPPGRERAAGDCGSRSWRLAPAGGRPRRRMPFGALDAFAVERESRVGAPPAGWGLAGAPFGSPPGGRPEVSPAGSASRASRGRRPLRGVAVGSRVVFLVARPRPRSVPLGTLRSFPFYLASGGRPSSRVRAPLFPCSSPSLILVAGRPAPSRCSAPARARPGPGCRGTLGGRAASGRSAGVAG